jgi:hypothetical protein
MLTEGKYRSNIKTAVSNVRPNRPPPAPKGTNTVKKSRIDIDVSPEVFVEIYEAVSDEDTKAFDINLFVDGKLAGRMTDISAEDGGTFSTLNANARRNIKDEQ